MVQILDFVLDTSAADQSEGVVDWALKPDTRHNNMYKKYFIVEVKLLLPKYDGGVKYYFQPNTDVHN